MSKVDTLVVGLTLGILEDAREKAAQNTTAFYIMGERDRLRKTGVAGTLAHDLTAEVTMHPNHGKPFYKVEIFSLLDSGQVVGSVREKLERNGFVCVDPDTGEPILGANAKVFLDTFVLGNDDLTPDAKALMQQEALKVGPRVIKDNVTGVVQEGRTIIVSNQSGKAYYYLP